MAYDVARQRVLLFGGTGLNGLVSDTWEWDGSKWTQRSPITSPSVVSRHAMAYDLARKRVVLFGGLDLNARSVADTWHYSHPAATQPFGTACSGSRTPPILTSDTLYLGHPSFGFELIGARPASPCVFGLSSGRQGQPIPPCTLYLQSPIVPLLAVTNWAGFARSQGFAVPLDGNLRGLTLYAQAFIADPQGPVSGLTLSAGLRLVIGD